jgi:hypothetical protein
MRRATQRGMAGATQDGRAERDADARSPRKARSTERERSVHVIEEGGKAPAVVARAYDGRTFDIGNPGRRTVLYFYPKASTSG